VYYLSFAMLFRAPALSPRVRGERGQEPDSSLATLAQNDTSLWSDTDMILVDAHLDLSYNALRGREVLRPAIEQTADAEGIPTVGLPDLRAGNVGLVCATIFCEPSVGGKAGYRTADEAHAIGLTHLEWYRTQEQAGHFRFVRA